MKCRTMDEESNVKILVEPENSGRLSDKRATKRKERNDIRSLEFPCQNIYHVSSESF